MFWPLICSVPVGLKTITPFPIPRLNYHGFQSDRYCPPLRSYTKAKMIHKDWTSFIQNCIQVPSARTEFSLKVLVLYTVAQRAFTLYYGKMHLHLPWFFF